jgi:hypothetical protein
MKTRLVLALALAATNLLVGLSIAGCGSSGSTTGTIAPPTNTIALSCPNGPCSVQTSVVRR